MLDAKHCDCLFSCSAYYWAAPGAPGNMTSEARLGLQGRSGFLPIRLLGPSQRDARFPARVDIYANSAQKYSRKGKTNTPPQKKRKGQFEEIERASKSTKRGLTAPQKSHHPTKSGLQTLLPFLDKSRVCQTSC